MYFNNKYLIKNKYFEFKKLNMGLFLITLNV